MKERRQSNYYVAADMDATCYAAQQLLDSWITDSAAVAKTSYRSLASLIVMALSGP